MRKSDLGDRNLNQATFLDDILGTDGYGGFLAAILHFPGTGNLPGCLLHALTELIPIADSLEGKLKLALFQDVLLGGCLLRIVATQSGAIILGISTLANLVEVRLGIRTAQLCCHQQDIGVTDKYPILELTDLEIAYKLANPDNEEGRQFDYCNLDGSAKGIQLTAASGIEDATLVMNSESKSYIYTAPDGSQVSGKYTLTDEGIFSFDKGFGNTQLSATGNYNMHANADNTLRILKVSKDDYTGHLKDLWLGSQCLDDQGNLYQYQAYHWVAQSASSASGPKYKANLFFNNSGWGWKHDGDIANYMSTNVFITGDGDYSLKFEGAESNPYLLYIDVNKILKDNPNCDITIKSIKVDGKSVDFDDTLIPRGYTDDDPSTNSFRRYVLNPWGPAACFKFDSGNNEFTDFKCSSSIEVVITVKMDTGAPVVTPSEGK
jgi:hypothetical protein